MYLPLAIGYGEHNPDLVRRNCDFSIAGPSAGGAVSVLRNLRQNNLPSIGAALVLVVIVGVVGMLWLGNFAEKRRFAAIEPSMTTEQVLAILGPPGPYGPPGAKYGSAMWEG